MLFRSDLDKYKESIELLLGPTKKIIRNLRKEISEALKTRKNKPTVVLTAGSDQRVLKAAKQCNDGGEVNICLLGNPEKIREAAKSVGIRDLSGITIVNPASDSRQEDYAHTLYELRNRKGISRTIARHIITDECYFAAMMLNKGDADAMISGIKNPYRKAVIPILEVIKAKKEKSLAGVYMMVKEKNVTFFADCTINIDPCARTLANIAISAAKIAASYTNEPIKVAMLSFASFGASSHPAARKVADAVSILKKEVPHLEVDGEMQVDVALDPSLREQEFPFSSLKGSANVLVFPDLNSANIAYKLLTKMGGAMPTGPILVGVNKPAHVIQRSASVEELVNMIYISSHQALCHNDGD